MNKNLEVDREMVDHPPHYTMGEYEVKDVIRDWDMNFALGSAIKYIARSERKGTKVQDLEKAIFFIQDEIKHTLKEVEK